MSEMTIEQMIHTVSNKTGLNTDRVEKILYSGILYWYQEAKKNYCRRRVYLKEEAREMGLALESVLEVETSLTENDLKFINDQGDQFMGALSSGQIPEAMTRSITSLLNAMDRTENETHEAPENILMVAHALYDIDISQAKT